MFDYYELRFQSALCTSDIQISSTRCFTCLSVRTLPVSKAKFAENAHIVLSIQIAFILTSCVF